MRHVKFSEFQDKKQGRYTGGWSGKVTKIGMVLLRPIKWEYEIDVIFPTCKSTYIYLNQVLIGHFSNSVI